jgi:hypothetical protein
VAVGGQAAQFDQGIYGVAIGGNAGRSLQGQAAVAIGMFAGDSGQGQNGIAVGESAGHASQGQESVALGYYAGSLDQETHCVAVGSQAGYGGQGNNAVAVGHNAGANFQGSGAVAVGSGAGQGQQGQYAVAVGCAAAPDAQGANTIVLNATGSALNTGATGATYIAPLRVDNDETVSGHRLRYADSTSEVTRTAVNTNGAGTSASVASDSSTYFALGVPTSVTTSTKVLVIVTAALTTVSGNSAYVSFTVTGATTLGADDTRALIQPGLDTPVCTSASFVVDTLTPGVNTFVMRGRSDGATVLFDRPSIAVIPLPM